MSGILSLLPDLGFHSSAIPKYISSTAQSLSTLSNAKLMVIRSGNWRRYTKHYLIDFLAISTLFLWSRNRLPSISRSPQFQGYFNQWFQREMACHYIHSGSIRWTVCDGIVGIQFKQGLDKTQDGIIFSFLLFFLLYIFCFRSFKDSAASRLYGHEKYIAGVCNHSLDSRRPQTTHNHNEYIRLWYFSLVWFF